METTTPVLDNAASVAITLEEAKAFFEEKIDSGI